MEIEQLEFKIKLSSRELYLLTYAVNEVLEITVEHELKRGFSVSMQSEMVEVKESLKRAVENFGKSLHR